MANDVLYREFRTLARLAWSFGSLSVLLVVVSSASDHIFQGLLALAAVLLVFPVLHLRSIYRMNRIVLTPSRLKVGTESFQPADFDFTFGVQPPLVLLPKEQAQIESPWPLPPDHELRIAGSSWGRRIGTAMVVLRETDSRRVVAIFTRHPEVLDPLLTEWIEQPPDPPEDTSPGR